MSVFKGAAQAVVNAYDKYPRLNAPYSYLLQVESMKSVVSKNPATLGTIFVITEFKVIDTNDPAPSHQMGCHVSSTISNAGKQAPYFLPEMKNLISKVLGLKESDPAYKQYLSNDSPDPAGSGMTVTEAFFTMCCGDAQPLANRFVAARVTEQDKKSGTGSYAKVGWHIVEDPNTWRAKELGGLPETPQTFSLPAPLPTPAAMVAPAIPAPPAPVMAPPTPPAAPWAPRDGWVYHPGNPPGDTSWCYHPATQQSKLTHELRVAQGG